MNRIFATCLLILLFSYLSKAQEKKPAFGVKLKGFVNYEMIYDSRQMVAARDGDVLLYPSPVKLDPNGKDINANSSFNALAITSRLNVGITGPDAFGAKTSGMLEGDFFGTANDKTGLFRLRHAFAKLSWEKTSLLAGKTWHPMFAVEVFPKVLSFGAAIPFYPLSRAPQLRYTVNGKHFQWMAAISTQEDFATAGPNGRSASYLMNTGLPELNTRVMYRGKNLILGVGASYWQVQPLLETTSGYQTDEKAEGFLINSFGKVNFSKLTLRGGYLYGKNLSNFFMLGGFGIASVSDDIRQEQTYESIGTSSIWGEIETNNKVLNVGLFAGYTQNHGADAKIAGAIYSVGKTIDNTYRISPRITISSGKMKFGLEGVYQSVAYGTPDDYGNVINTEDVDGLRLVSSIVYYF